MPCQAFALDRRSHVNQHYPSDAYTLDGELWWEAEYRPGTRQKLGAEPKLAAWLYWNVDLGHTFTMRDVRTAIDSDDEHVNRRLRKLREYGWVIPSGQDDASLRPTEYRLDQVGWWPGQGRRPNTKGSVSNRVKAEVIARDGSRCVLCGIGAAEAYPREPGSRAVLTVGHRVPKALGGSDLSENLRTECSRCNEPRRESTGTVESYAQVFADVRRLGVSDKRVLLSWLQTGERIRNTLDTTYDRARILSSGDREKLVHELLKATSKG